MFWLHLSLMWRSLSVAMQAASLTCAVSRCLAQLRQLTCWPGIRVVDSGSRSFLFSNQRHALGFWSGEQSPWPAWRWL
ncbi:hypothetical protein GQ54DRAFT_197577 [Martensiomyces pterosporus]|nr:hypothetical protein GQ54DRAFT_197577 [Martensiomyces pterosporus]